MSSMLLSLKEAIHLKSDIGTANSLPIPVISVFSPELASSLANYGFDMANILFKHFRRIIAYFCSKSNAEIIKYYAKKHCYCSIGYGNI